MNRGRAQAKAVLLDPHLAPGGPSAPAARRDPGEEAKDPSRHPSKGARADPAL